MQSKMVQTSYLLGISFILTSILYFFASNWQYFERITKIILAIFLLILFYAAHFVLKRWVTWQTFLSNWMLIAAGIVFGIAVALIGQVYNSHADSYTLFLIWLIPMLLLAFITRYVPFYVLSYALSQLTMLFFIFPSAYLPEWQNGEILLMLLGMIAFNIGLFYLSYRDKIQSRTILYLTYIMCYSLGFYIVIMPFFPYHIGLNFLFILILIGAGYYWYKIKLQKPLLTITIIFTAIYAVYRVFYWVLDDYDEFILYALLIFAIGLTFIGGIIIGLLNKNKMNQFLVNALTITITIITTLFAVVAILGLSFLLFPGVSEQALYIFAFIALILPGLFINIPAQFRYSLLGTGFVLAFFVGMNPGQIYYQLILLIPLCIGIYTIQHPGVKVLTYIFTNIVLGYALFNQFFEFQIIYLVLFILNTSYYLTMVEEKATNYTAFFIAALNVLSLTFVDTAIGLQILYNFTFLFGVPFLLFVWYKNGSKIEPVTMLVFWFIFLGAKYYDYLWTLFHKSIAALVIGILFMTVAYLFDRPSKTAAPTGSIFIYRTSFLIALIVLQVGFIGFQAITNEKTLQEGDRIKLALEPVDPRSILQGDYLALHYDINEIDEGIPSGKIKVVLREDNGEYNYAGYYQKDNEWNKRYNKESRDVIINGKVQNYNQVLYGIETFFIPEDTGLELENEAEYAYVRVSKSGDAIVEEVQ